MDTGLADIPCDEVRKLAYPPKLNSEVICMEPNDACATGCLTEVGLEAVDIKLGGGIRTVKDIDHYIKGRKGLLGGRERPSGGPQRIRRTWLGGWSQDCSEGVSMILDVMQREGSTHGSPRLASDSSAGASCDLRFAS